MSSLGAKVEHPPRALTPNAYARFFACFAHMHSPLACEDSLYARYHAAIRAPRFRVDWERGLDSRLFGTHSLQRTKIAPIYWRAINLWVVELLLGHTKIESTVRYLVIEVDDALAIAEQVNV